jgi:hypothetical protein
MIVATQREQPAQGLVLRCVAASLALLAFGCADELRPERMVDSAVSGHLRMGGKPAGPCWLEFLPVEGTVGLLRSAQVRPDGTFHAGGVAVGNVAIRVVGLVPVRSGDPRLDRFLALAGQVYIIRRTVPPGGAPALDIDLADEAAAFARSHAEP